MGGADETGIDGAGLPSRHSVVVDPVDASSSVADLIRHQVAVSVRQLLEHDPGVRLGEDPEAVHQYRVAARRLRSDLRTFRSELDRDATDARRDDLRWLGGVVGPVRDLDVLGARMAEHGGTLPDLDQPGVAAVLGRVAAARDRARIEVIDALGTPRYVQLLEALVAFASEPPLAASSGHADRPAAARAGRVVRRRWRQLDAAVQAAGPDPSDVDLHRIRIAAKRCRYAAEAVAPAVGRPGTRFAARIEDVQTVLGDHHDTVVAEAWLRDAAVDLVDARVAIGGLIAIERATRARLRAEWPAVWHRASRKKARAWF